MKVVQINTVFGYGSTGRNCAELAAYVRQCGEECYVAYGQLHTDEPYTYRIGNALESKLHNVGSRLFCRQGYYSKRATRRLVAWLSLLQPDIMHLHNLHGNYLNLEVLFSYLAKARTPIVWTLHDCWAYTGKCVYYTESGCYKWTSGCHHCGQIRRYPPSLWVDASRKVYADKKRLFTSVDNMTIITVSDWLKGEVADSFLSKYPVKRIHNWIDTSVFSPVDAGEVRRRHGLGGKFVILGVSSGWDMRKLRTFLQLSKAMANRAVICLVGRAKHRKRLPQNVVTINETQSTRELAQYYSMADVYVNASLEETFGKTTAEAMACGTPCVVYDSTASPELVGERCGYVVKPNDIRGVVNAIEQIRRRGKVAFQDACVAHAHAAFNYYDRARDHRELYRQLLGA